MKVALFSPMPPERSGIADYSALLLPALRARCDVLVVKRGAKKPPRGTELCVYHIGNNPDAHGWIVQALRRTPGVVVFRPEGSLVYFNAEHVLEAVQARLRREAEPVRAVVCDLSASPYVDVAGAEMLRSLEAEVRIVGARLHIVEARSSVRDRLRLEGIEKQTGAIDRYTTIADAVDSENPPG